MVHLQKLHEQYSTKGLLTLAISLHRSSELARQQTKELGIDYPVANGYGSGLDRDYGYA